MRKDQANCVIALLTPGLAVEVRFSSRDWKLLQEDYVPGSAAFLHEFGFLGITRVADGLRVGQTVDRTRQGALAVAEGLWSQLASQMDLLANDYLCEPERQHGVVARTAVSRRLGNVRIGTAEYTIEMPPGQCRLEAAPTVIEQFDPSVGRVCVHPVRHPIQDLRLQQVFRSDNYGDIRIRKRRRGNAWDTAIPALLEVLRTRTRRNPFKSIMRTGNVQSTQMMKRRRSARRIMSTVFVNIGLSLDGYMAPEGMTIENWGNPGYKNWGAKWGALMAWALNQQYLRQNLGLGPGGETGPVNDLLRSTTERIGANIMGKRMFDQGERSWPENAPFHTQVYVLTHEQREPWVRPGGTTFHFVNDGPERALELARESAGNRDVRIAGGADVIQQYLNLGVVDELEIALAPVFFGGGRRLFENMREPGPQFRIDKILDGPDATHLRYVRQ